MSVELMLWSVGLGWCAWRKEVVAYLGVGWRRRAWSAWCRLMLPVEVHHVGWVQLRSLMEYCTSEYFSERGAWRGDWGWRYVQGRLERMGAPVVSGRVWCEYVVGEVIRVR